MVVCLEQGADLHMAQLMPLPLTVSCFSKIQIGFTFLVPAHLCSHGKRAVKEVCVTHAKLGTRGIKFLSCLSVCALHMTVYVSMKAFSDWLAIDF